MNADDVPWQLYRSLLALLHEGSLSGAARSLGLTQPTVSRHLDTLEAQLGRELFLRSPRGLSPTDLALELQPYAEHLASIAAALQRTATASADRIRGVVRISASQVIGVEVLPAILTRLHQAHPDLRLELVLSNRVDDLLHREADLAVRMVQPSQSALIAKRVGDVGLGFFAHRDYLARRGTPTTWEDLSAHAVIGVDRGSPAIRRMLASLPGGFPTAFSLRSDSDLAQLAAIRAGFGVGACQCAVARRDPALVHVLPDLFALALPTWVVMHEDLSRSPRCRVVFDALVSGLAEHVDR